MTPPDSYVAEASRRRLDLAQDEEFDRTLSLLLANYERVTANPRSMGYLRFLLKHYAKSPTPWRDCYRDNFKRFGDRTKGVCSVLKDTLRQGTGWRGHSERDHGSPGVAIGEADKAAAPPFGGHSNLKLSQEDGCDLDKAFMAEFGVDEVPGEVFDILLQLASTCNVRRVLLGLDEPPIPVAA